MVVRYDILTNTQGQLNENFQGSGEDCSTLTRQGDLIPALSGWGVHSSQNSHQDRVYVIGPGHGYFVLVSLHYV